MNVRLGWLAGRFLLLAALALAPAAGVAHDAAKDEAWEKQVHSLVAVLGSDDFDLREAAQKALVQEGEKVLAVLDRLPPQADPEVRARLRAVRREIGGLGEDIRRALADMPDIRDEVRPPLPSDLAALLKSHQPRAGDCLLSILAHRQDPLHRRATNAFLQTWDAMTAEQADAYFQRAIDLTVKMRKQYPQGIDASAEMSYCVCYGWGGWPAEAAVRLDTRTTHFVDGKPVGAPYAYQGPMACTGWAPTKDLATGKHTLSLTLDYEFSHHGEPVKGRIRSKEFAFEVTDAATPDDLVAPRDRKDDAAVRDGFCVAETEEAFNPPAGPVVGGPAPPDPWAPQITWTSPAGKACGLHVPLWKVPAGLPDDLCFEVEMQVVKTGESFPCDALVLRRGVGSSGYFSPREARAFARGRSGYVPVKIVLKPSRCLALTYPEVTRYYPGPITSEVLRVKVSGE